jgi:hypothetical protein
VLDGLYGPHPHSFCNPSSPVLVLKPKNVAMLIPLAVEAMFHATWSNTEVPRAVSRIDVPSDKYVIALTAIVGEATLVISLPALPVDEDIAKPYVTVNARDRPAKTARAVVNLSWHSGLSNLRSISAWRFHFSLQIRCLFGNSGEQCWTRAHDCCFFTVPTRSYMCSLFASRSIYFSHHFTHWHKFPNSSNTLCCHVRIDGFPPTKCSE